jgi:hypothetical protein
MSGSPEIPEPFPFTREELFQAFRMVEPESAARKHAAEIASVGASQNWAMSEETLLLLSLASDEARSKADRLRKELQKLDRSVWLSEQGGPSQRSTAEELEDAWALEVDRQDREWSYRREELIRTLRNSEF